MDEDPVDMVVGVSRAEDEDDADELTLAVAETEEDALDERDSAHDTILADDDGDAENIGVDVSGATHASRDALHI